MSNGKTIQEIQARYSEQANELLEGYHRKIDGIAAEREPEGGELLGYLTPQQRGELLLDQMTEKIDQERAARIEEATAAFERYQDGHQRRVEELDRRLYHVEDADQMVANVVIATDEQLARLLEAARRTNSLNLAKVILRRHRAATCRRLSTASSR